MLVLIRLEFAVTMLLGNPFCVEQTMLTDLHIKVLLLLYFFYHVTPVGSLFFIHAVLPCNISEDFKHAVLLGNVPKHFLHGVMCEGEQGYSR